MDHGCAHWLDDDDLLKPFGHPLFIQFRNHPDLLNCNKHGVQILLLPFQASPFGIENQLKFLFFSRRDLRPQFFSFYSLLYAKICFGTPFKIQWDTKWLPKSTTWRKHINTIISRYGLFVILKPTPFQKVGRRAYGSHFL